MKTRREMIATSAALAAESVIGSQFFPVHAAAPQYTRFAAPSEGGAQNLAVLARAVRIMKGNDPGHPISREIRALGTNAANHRFSWQRQQVIHAGHWYQHGTWRFFPWHRLQLTAFEAIVRHLTNAPSFSLPYWDAREHQTIPPVFFDRSSPLWVENRAATSATNLGALWDRLVSNRMIELAGVFDQFPRFHGGPVERMPWGENLHAGIVDPNTHGRIHVLIGGLMSNPQTATLDPIFWLHHANMDRIWATWQELNQRSVSYPAGFLLELLGNAFVHPGLNLARWRTQEVLNTATIANGMAYKYDRLYPYPRFAPAQLSPGWQRIPKKNLSIQCERVPAEPDAGREVLSLEVPADFLPANTGTLKRHLHVIGKMTVDATTIRAPFLRISAVGPAKEAVWQLLAPFLHLHSDGKVRIEFELDDLPELDALLAGANDGRLKIMVSQVDASNQVVPGGNLNADISVDLSVSGIEQQGAPQ